MAPKSLNLTRHFLITLMALLGMSAAVAQIPIATDGPMDPLEDNMFASSISAKLRTQDRPGEGLKGLFEAGVKSGVTTTAEGSCFDTYTGEVVPGCDLPIAEKGAQKPFAQTATMPTNQMVSDFLDDQVFVDERMNKFLTTKVGLAAAAIAFSQPAASQVYMQAVNVGYLHADACRQSHKHFMATIAQHPEGESMRDIYLGCLERKTREEGATSPDAPKLSMCNAISVCQGDTYATKFNPEIVNAAAGSSAPVPDANYWDDVRESLRREIRTASLPEHDPCHPLHPLQKTKSSEWSKAQIAEAGGEDNVRARMLFTDKLFCEYHFDEGQEGVQTEMEKNIRMTGLRTEAYFRKVVGNAALIWQRGFVAGNPNQVYENSFEVEWQKVAPRTMAWPPIEDGNPDFMFPVPEVLPLYRGGERFVALTQFMANRCRVYNAKQAIDFGSTSSLQRNTSGSTLPAATITIRNGMTDVALTGADANELIKTDFCNSQLEIVDIQRSFVSMPELPFHGDTCDAFWYKVQEHFDEEQQHDCDTLRGCVQEGWNGSTCGQLTCKDGVACPLSFYEIRENPTNYPLWAQMFYAYSSVGGYLMFKNELKALYAQIEATTGSRHAWMLRMARELIESRLDAEVEAGNERIMAALVEEVEKIIKTEISDKTGGSVISSTGGKNWNTKLPGS